MTDTTNGTTVTATREPVLRLQGLSKQYGSVTALDDVTFDVHDGESVALLGPSGSGKTTMLSMIAGFQTPSTGSLLLRGRDISALAPAERNIGIVFQHYALFPHLTVLDNIGYGLKMRGWDRARRRTRSMEMLELVHLTHCADRTPKQLSGGQQQRVALARALAFEPSLLLLDEPLGALDRAIRGQMQIEIRRIQRELGTTMIHVTHDKEEALALGDRIAVMRDGRIVGADTPYGLHQDPRSSFVASFFCAYNLLDVEILSTGADKALIVWNGEQIAVPQSGELGSASAKLAIPPTALRVNEGPRDGAISMNARVLNSVYLGEVTEVTTELENSAIVVLRVTPHRAQHLIPGESIVLSVDTADTAVVPTD